MAPNQAQPPKAPPRGASGRIDDLEKLVYAIVQNVNTEFSRVFADIGRVSDVLNATVDVVGAAEVQALLDAREAQRIADIVAADKADIEKQTKEGTLVVAEAIGKDSLIIGLPKNKEGGVNPPGRVRVAISQMAKPEDIQKLLGQKVGFVFGPTVSGGTMEILEIYTVVPPKPKEKPVEAATATPPVAPGPGEVGQPAEAAPEAPAEA